MDTKEKILFSALKLFNKYGTENITVRHIAKEVGISHGNLCYHFPNTDDIILKLYENLVQELNLEISKIEQKEINLKLVYAVSRVTFELLYKYKFLMIDFVNVMRRIDKIKVHYRDLVKMRKMQFTFMINHLIENKIFKPEIIPGQYQSLNEMNFIIGDFWISHAEIIFEGKEKSKIDHYLKIMFAPVIATLTPKGLEEYKALFG
jgi:AcrR family transcriptional regulator